MDVGNIINQSRLKVEQSREDNFSKIYKEHLAKVNGDLQQLKLMQTYPQFKVHRDLLYHIDKVSIPGEKIDEHLIPKMYGGL